MISFDSFLMEAGIPIYLQIILFIKRGMVSGQIRSGDELPSRRTLSALLGVNPNTIQKAYEALESEGYVYSVAGKGSFAAGHQEADDVRRSELLSQIREIAAELKYLGATPEELAAIVKEAFEA